MHYGILLYALVAVLIGATDASTLDGIDTQQGPLTLDSNCARMNLVDVLYSCKAGSNNDALPRLSASSLLWNCVNRASTRRPIRVMSPDFGLARSLASAANSSFARATGISISFDILPLTSFTGQRRLALRDPAPPNDTSGYDAIITAATGFGDAAQVPGKLTDITFSVARDRLIDWADLSPLIRSAGAFYNGSVSGIPLLGTTMILMYRLDIFRRDNLTVPQTWEQMAELAERYHNGSDNLIGACLNPIGCGSETLVLRAIFGSYVQTQGPSHGVLWDPETLEPLVDTPAMEAALALVRRFRAVGPTESDAPMCRSERFMQGRCLMALSDGAEFKLGSLGGPRDPNTAMRGRMGMAPLPGTTRVLDRATRTLVPCTAQRCPLAIDTLQEADGQRVLVNQAQFVSVTVALINGLSSPEYVFYTYNLFSFLASPRVVGTRGLLREPNELTPMRLADTALGNLPLWVARGYDYGDARRFLEIYGRVLQNTNVNSDLKLRLSSNITANLLTAATAPDNVTIQSVMENLRAALGEIVAAEGGPDAFAIQYRRSISWAPRAPPSSPPPQDRSDDSNSRTVVVVAAAVPCGAVTLMALVAGAVLVVARRRRRANESRAAGTAAADAPGPGRLTTLCVTDIQDSTVLWEALPAVVMDNALDVHHRLMRETAVANRGYESWTEGDSFVLAFPTPLDGLKFSVEVQQALLIAPWPAELLAFRPSPEEGGQAKDSPCGEVLMCQRLPYRGLRRAASALGPAVSLNARRRVTTSPLPSATVPGPSSSTTSSAPSQLSARPPSHEQQHDPSFRHSQHRSTGLPGATTHPPCRPQACRPTDASVARFSRSAFASPSPFLTPDLLGIPTSEISHWVQQGQHAESSNTWARVRHALGPLGIGSTQPVRPGASAVPGQQAIGSVTSAVQEGDGGLLPTPRRAASRALAAVAWGAMLLGQEGADSSRPKWSGSGTAAPGAELPSVASPPPETAAEHSRLRGLASAHRYSQPRMSADENGVAQGLPSTTSQATQSPPPSVRGLQVHSATAPGAALPPGHASPPFLQPFRSHRWLQAHWELEQAPSSSGAHTGAHGLPSAVLGNGGFSVTSPGAQESSSSCRHEYAASPLQDSLPWAHRAPAASAHLLGPAPVPNVAAGAPAGPGFSRNTTYSGLSDTGLPATTTAATTRTATTATAAPYSVDSSAPAPHSLGFTQNNIGESVANNHVHAQKETLVPTDSLLGTLCSQWAVVCKAGQFARAGARQQGDGEPGAGGTEPGAAAGEDCTGNGEAAAVKGHLSDASPRGPAHALTVVYRGMRVRIGLHTGLPSPHDVTTNTASGRVQYTGTPLRLARAVSDAAHGGMILISSATVAALEASSDNPSHPLKGLRALVLWQGEHEVSSELPPMHLFQVAPKRLLGRVVLQKPLRTQGAVPPLLGVLQAPMSHGVLARLVVSGAGSLLSWDRRVATEALDLLHRMLLEQLRLVAGPGQVVYVAEGATGLCGGAAGRQLAADATFSTQGEAASAGHNARALARTEAAGRGVGRMLTVAEGNGATRAGPVQSGAGPPAATGVGSGVSSAAPRSSFLSGPSARLPLSAALRPSFMSGSSSRLFTPLQLARGESSALTTAAAPAAPATAPVAAAKHGALPGVMTVVFQDPVAAAVWLFRCMELLPRLDWSAELLQHPLCEPIQLDSVAAVDVKGDVAAGPQCPLPPAATPKRPPLRQPSYLTTDMLRHQQLEQEASVPEDRWQGRSSRTQSSMVPSLRSVRSALGLGPGAGPGVGPGGAVSPSFAGPTAPAPAPPHQRLLRALVPPLPGLPAAHSLGSKPAARSCTNARLTVQACATPMLQPPSQPSGNNAASGMRPVSSTAALRPASAEARLPSSPAQAGAVDGAGSTGCSGGMPYGYMLFRGLRACGSLSNGELGGSLPGSGLAGQVAYRGRAWATLGRLTAKAKLGQVNTNPATAALLPPAIAGGLIVIKHA